MSRLKDIRKYVNKSLSNMDDKDDMLTAAGHLYGVSTAAQLIAKKRGMDPELAGMAGLLHDLYAYKSGSYDDHAHKGADYAKDVLTELGITNKEETAVICSAIWHHDNKAETDSPMDEVLKDADVIHHSLGDPTKEVKEHEKARYEKLCREFGL